MPLSRYAANRARFPATIATARCTRSTRNGDAVVVWTATASSSERSRSVLAASSRLAPRHLPRESHAEFALGAGGAHLAMPGSVDLLEIDITCDGEVTSTRIARFPAYVGRDDDCEVRVPYPFVSRRHARIDVRGDRFVLRDLGSLNGIIVGETRLGVDDSLPLEEGTTFRLDRALVTVRRCVAVHASAPGAGGTSETPTSLYAEQQISPELITRAGVIVEEYRAARRAMLRSMREAFEAVPDSQRAPIARAITTLYPEVAADRGVQDLLAARGVEVVGEQGQSVIAPANRAASPLATMLHEVLSPTSIRTAAAKSRWHGPFWAWALWREYNRRYHRVIETFGEGNDGSETEPTALVPRSGVPASVKNAETREEEDETATHWPFGGPAWL